MLDWLKKWYAHKFSDPQVVTLFLLLLIGFMSIYWLSGILAPVLVAIAFAYLLEWPVVNLTRFGLSRAVSTVFVVAAFVGVGTLTLMWIVPIFWYRQPSTFGPECTGTCVDTVGSNVRKAFDDPNDSLADGETKT